MNKFVKVLGKRGRVTIPIEIRGAAGFEYNDVLSFELAEDNAVLIRKEKVCDCAEIKPEEKKETLLDFLNGLSPEQQAAVLVHLSIKIAERQGKDNVKV